MYIVYIIYLFNQTSESEHAFFARHKITIKINEIHVTSIIGVSASQNWPRNGYPREQKLQMVQIYLINLA